MTHLKFFDPREHSSLPGKRAAQLYKITPASALQVAIFSCRIEFSSGEGARPLSTPHFHGASILVARIFLFSLFYTLQSVGEYGSTNQANSAFRPFGVGE